MARFISTASRSKRFAANLRKREAQLESSRSRLVISRVSGGSSTLRSLKINKPNRRPRNSGVFFRHLQSNSRLANIGIALSAIVVATEAASDHRVQKPRVGTTPPFAASPEPGRSPTSRPEPNDRLEIFPIFLWACRLLAHREQSRRCYLLVAIGGNVLQKSAAFCGSTGFEHS